MQRAQFMNDRGVPHSTILLAPNILPENALLNKSVKEIERIALEEAEKISPRYTRGKEIKRKGYAKYKFLKEFNIIKTGRRIIYKVHWITVKLTNKDGKRVKTSTEEELEKESELVKRELLTTLRLEGN